MTFPFFNKGLCFASARLAVVLVAMCVILAAGCAIQPAPLTDAQNIERVRQDQASLYANQEPLDGPLTLSEAIARALLYNYDSRVAMMDAVLQDENLDLMGMDMLPQLAANAGFTHRSNELAAESISYETRRRSLEASVSQEPTRFTSDLSLTWSILDFGVSYFQAKQQADRYLIAVERRRHVVNNIVNDVIYLYWRAVTAERLLPVINDTLVKAQSALADYEEIERQQLEPIIYTLEQRKALLQIVTSLKQLEHELTLAKMQLAALANLPLDEPYSVAIPNGPTLSPPELHTDPQTLQTLGLFYRPDLREQVYQERIDQNGVYMEMVRMFPNLGLSGNLNYDTNKYYVHNFWAQVGARVAADLVSLLEGPQRIEAAETQVDIDELKRMALSVAAVVQINVSWQQYLQARDAYQDARSINEIEQRILQAVDAAMIMDAAPGLEFIRRTTSAILAQLESDVKLAEVYKALSNLHFSIGNDIYDVLPDQGTSLTALTQDVDLALDRLYSGQLPTLPAEAVAVDQAADENARSMAETYMPLTTEELSLAWEEILENGDAAETMAPTAAPAQEQ